MLFTLSSFLKYLDLCPKCFLFWGQKKHHPVKSGAKPKQIMKNSTSAKRGGVLAMKSATPLIQ